MIRRLLLLLCLASLLTAGAAAYIVTIDVPRTIPAGDPIIVNGTSNLPVGFTTDLILYQGMAERARTTVVVQPDRTFGATFETAGLPQGEYKVELERQRDPTLYGSASVTARPVTLVDRSGEVTITSPSAQIDVANLTVSGIAPGKKSGSIGIAVSGPGNFTHAPEYVRTDGSGAFSLVVAIPGPGDYRVTVLDQNGVITRFPVTVATAPETTVPTTAATPSVEVTLPPTTATTTMAPTPTQSGPSILPLAGLGLALLTFRSLNRRP